MSRDYISFEDSVKRISEKLGIEPANVRYVIRSTFKRVNLALKRGKEVKIYGFGKFVFNKRGKVINKTREKTQLYNDRKKKSRYEKIRQKRRKGL